MSINYKEDRICAFFEGTEYNLVNVVSIDATGWFFDNDRECMYPDERFTMSAYGDIIFFKGFDTPEAAIQDALSRGIKVYKLSETEITTV